MPNKELIDAIRNGTAKEIALQLALLPCYRDGFDAEHITAEAIVAARPKAEDVVAGKVAIYQAGIFSAQMPGLLTTRLDPGEFGEFHTGYKVTITREPSNG